jgi:hypothetical protein
MANINVQIDKVTKRIEQKLKAVQAKAVMDTATMLSNEIKDSISKGISPAEGEGRFQGYSDSYLEQIKKQTGYLKGSGKRKRPVNLFVTGTMLNSLKKRITLKGFVLWFTSPIAKYHNDLGAGKSRVIRKMFPGDDQNFSRSITRKLQLNIRKIVFSIFR